MKEKQKKQIRLKIKKVVSKNAGYVETRGSK